MFTRTLRENLKRPEGQALVLACVLLLVLSLAVLTTVSLGHATHERIRLQNTADAAAYSMAAMEARAFNLYAFANRTQASHYVSAMLFQSLLSFVYFEEAFLTDVYGVMLTLDPCARPRGPFWHVACLALKRMPWAGPVLGFIGGSIGLFGELVKAFQLALRESNADEVIGRDIIPGLRTLNSGLAQLSGGVMQAALAQVQGTAGELTAENEPDVDVASNHPLTGALSACLFDRAHFREAFGSPLAPRENPDAPIPPGLRAEASKEARAKRAMAQIANGSRYGCDGRSGPCPERFITSRKLDLIALPGVLRPVSDFLASLPKHGQTRLLTFKLGRGWNDEREGGNLIREPVDTPDAPSSMLAQGDNLGADDLYEIKLPPLNCDPDTGRYWECWGDPRRNRRDFEGQRPFRFMMKTSVWALNDDEGEDRGGIHWRVAFPGYPRGKGHVDPTARDEALWLMGLNQVERKVAGVPLPLFTANVRPIHDGNHAWRGLAPFPHFEPGQFAQTCASAMAGGGAGPSLSVPALRKEDFNQPTSWVLLTKVPARMPGWNGALTLSQGGRRARLELEDRGGALQELGLTPGLNVLARGQVYYHRPGNWAEQPNFFNPYWRPRLASVHQGRESLPWIKELLDKLPPELRRAPQKALTH